jgi:hypothetical protein
MRIVILVLLLAWSGSSAAETATTCKGYIDALPAVISTQGTWCLRKDVATAMTSGYAITVAAPNVAIDCNGYKIGGLGAGPETQAIGIVSNGYLNTVVRNCSIRGFFYGIATPGGGGALIEDNLLELNTLIGVFVGGDGGTIRRNRIHDTGSGASYAWGLATNGQVDVIGNTISGVYPNPGTAVYAVGIQSSANAGSVIRGNILREIEPGGNGSIAIYIYDDALRVVIEDNELIDPGISEASLGIYCGGRSSFAVATGNSILGFGSPLFSCFDAGDNVVVALP